MEEIHKTLELTNGDDGTATSTATTATIAATAFSDASNGLTDRHQSGASIGSSQMDNVHDDTGDKDDNAVNGAADCTVETVAFDIVPVHTGNQNIIDNCIHTDSTRQFVASNNTAVTDVPFVTENNGDSEFGDFGAAVPHTEEVNAVEQGLVDTEDSHDFGDFDEAGQLPSIQTANDSSEVIPIDDKDDFGAFDATESMIESSVGQLITAVNDSENVVNNDDNDFGHFDSTEPIGVSTISHNVPIDDVDCNNNEDDDFGDFDTAEAPPIFSTNENGQMDNDDDDDDFGDFDEAPAIVQNEDDTIVETAVPRGNGPILTSGGDPIVDKLKYAFSNIFKRYSNEEKSAEEYDDNGPIPYLIEDEIVSIDSVMASLQADMPLVKNDLSINSIYLVQNLFTTSVDIATTPSRCIITKKVIPSPILCPLNGLVSVSDRARRSKPVGNVQLHAVGNNGQLLATNPLNQQTEKDAGPSEQAKAFLERIPDLSYMLATKLSIPSSK